MCSRQSDTGYNKYLQKVKKYFTLKNGNVTIKLNITVNHSLVDGYPLSKAFLKVQEMLDNVEQYIK